MKLIKLYIATKVILISAFEKILRNVDSTHLVTISVFYKVILISAFIIL